MAQASGKKFGAGIQGKGDGTGAMTEIEPEDVPANEVLSNRDKQQAPRKGGHDGKHVQTEQREDHAANRIPEG